MKKSRKRLLISSVAMLLVAMLALGTATFAWFTTSTTATADQLSVKTIKSSELQVSSASVDWTDTLHYAKTNVILKPASSVDGTNWYAATAAAKGAFDADVNTVAPIASDKLSDYVLVDQLNVRNNGNADVTGATISFSISETEANSGKYFRIAIVPVATKGGTIAQASDFANNVYGGESTTQTANAVSSVTVSGETKTLNTSAITAKAGSSVTYPVGNLQGKESIGNNATTGEAKFYNIYLWFEGQDSDCKDANAGNLISSITFTVSGDTATQS